MRRSTLSLSALLLLTPLAAAATLVVPSATAQTGHAEPTSQPGQALEAPDTLEAKEVTRQYGGRAVHQDRAGQRVEIRFRAHQGDLVMLTQAKRGDATPVSATLEGPKGQVSRTDEPWLQVRENGWHTFTTRPDLGKAADLLLNKVMLIDVARDAGPVSMEERRGRIYAAGFEVPAEGLLSGGVSGRGDELLLRPGHKALRSFGEQTLVLGNGLPLAPMQAFADGPAGQRNEKYAAGDVIRLLMRRGQAAAFTPSTLTATVDGPAVAVDQSDPRRVTQVVLSAGGWLQSGEAFSAGGTQDTVLLGPAGYVAQTAVPGLWRAPAGENRFIVFPDPASSAPATLEVDAIAWRAAIAVGAAPVRITQTVPGQDLIIPITGLAAGALAKVATSNAALPGDWRVHLVNESGQVANALVSASAAQPVSASGVGRWIHIPFAPGATGQVDLQALAG